MTTKMHIVEYDEVAEQINVVRDKANFIPDVTTTEGYEKSKRVSLDIGKLKTALENKRKDKKAYFLEGGRQVDSQAKAIAEQLDQIQSPHLLAYKELDNLKKEREARRKQDLEDRVSSMRLLAESLAECSSDEIKRAMEDVNKEECLDFYEFTEHALKARNFARSSLAALYSKKLQEEKDAAELVKLKAEQAEREQKERDERIAREASEKAEREKAEAIEREQAAIAAQARAEQDAIEAKARAEEQAKQAESNRIAAEAKAQQDAIEAQARADENARIAAENARLAEVERQRQQAESERLAKEAKEADTENKRRVHNEIMADLIYALKIDEQTAKAIVKVIAQRKISHLNINY